MSKRIVVIHGAPRKKGNTRAVTALAVEAARQEGAEVVEIDATALSFTAPGCIGCQQCQRSEVFACALDDELAHSVASLAEYDVVLLSTPLYSWSYSAQLKMVIDRMYSLNKFGEDNTFRSVMTGKTMAIIATAGGPMEDNLELLERQWQNPAAMLGCPFVSCLFPNVVVGPGALANDTAAAEKARAFGRQFAV